MELYQLYTPFEKTPFPLQSAVWNLLVVLYVHIISDEAGSQFRGTKYNQLICRKIIEQNFKLNI